MPLVVVAHYQCGRCPAKDFVRLAWQPGSDVDQPLPPPGWQQTFVIESPSPAGLTLPEGVEPSPARHEAIFMVLCPACRITT